MNFDAGIYKLTSDFYTDYPASEYPELLTKGDRPYSCLLIDTHAAVFSRYSEYRKPYIK